MIREIDPRPLTDEQWAVMFSGPEWDQETIEALSHSLPKAYEIHAKRLEPPAPKFAAGEVEP